MCLILEGNDMSEKLARDPISVWKILHRHADGLLVSPYFSHNGPFWNLGDEYSSPLGPMQQCPIHQSPGRAAMFAAGPISAINAAMTIEHGGRIDRGFHSLGSRSAANKVRANLYSQAMRNHRREEFVIVEMSIPRDAYYYHDSKRDEYASDRLYFNHDEVGS